MKWSRVSLAALVAGSLSALAESRVFRELQEVDTDGDGVLDSQDNCPGVANAGQADTDADGLGDACDACPNDPSNDVDGDGVCGDVDNCPSAANAGQADTDADGLGDACDACPDDPLNDVDGDAVCGDVDNCPSDANRDQKDFDKDGLGDVCDPDVDGDGVANDEDLCPLSKMPEITVAQISTNRWAAVGNTFVTKKPKGRKSKRGLWQEDVNDESFDGNEESFSEVGRFLAKPTGKPTNGNGNNGNGNNGGGNGKPDDEPYTMNDTLGCTCSQIVVKCKLGKGISKKGCPKGIIQNFSKRAGSCVGVTDPFSE